MTVSDYPKCEIYGFTFTSYKRETIRLYLQAQCNGNGIA